MFNNKEIIGVLICTMRFHHKVVEKYVSALGIHHGQHHLLMRLAKQEWKSQKELADSMEISTATVAVSLKKLEQGGYITREVVSDDNRYNQLEITDKGREVIKESCKIFNHIDETLFKGFTEEEKEEFGRLVKKMNQNLTEL